MPSEEHKDRMAGTLVGSGSGPDPYKNGQESHYVTVRMDDGIETQLWGNELASAIAESGAKPGERVNIEASEINLRAPEALKEQVRGDLAGLFKVDESGLRNAFRTIEDTAKRSPEYRAELARQDHAVARSVEDGKPGAADKLTTRDHIAGIAHVAQAAGVAPGIAGAVGVADAAKLAVDAAQGKPVRAIDAATAAASVMAAGGAGGPAVAAVQAAGVADAARRAMQEEPTLPEADKSKRVGGSVEFIARTKAREPLADAPTPEPRDRGAEAAESLAFPEAAPGASPGKIPVAPDESPPAAPKRWTVPESVETNFLRVGDKFHYRGGDQKLAFELKDGKMVAKTNDPLVARAFVDMAVASGAEALRVRGAEAFRREVWKEAMARGIEVDGYKPTRLEVAEMEQRRGPAQAPNEVAMTARTQAPTIDSLRPDERVMLHQPMDATAHSQGAQWWTTDRNKAAMYGNVRSVEVPAGAVGRHAASYNARRGEYLFLDRSPVDLARKPRAPAASAAAPSHPAWDPAPAVERLTGTVVTISNDGRPVSGVVIRTDNGKEHTLMGDNLGRGDTTVKRLAVGDRVTAQHIGIQPVTIGEWHNDGSDYRERVERLHSWVVEKPEVFEQRLQAVQARLAPRVMTPIARAVQPRPAVAPEAPRAAASAAPKDAPKPPPVPNHVGIESHGSFMRRLAEENAAVLKASEENERRIAAIAAKAQAAKPQDAAAQLHRAELAAAFRADGGKNTASMVAAHPELLDAAVAMRAMFARIEEDPKVVEPDKVKALIKEAYAYRIEKGEPIKAPQIRPELPAMARTKEPEQQELVRA